MTQNIFINKSIIVLYVLIIFLCKKNLNCFFFEPGFLNSNLCKYINYPLEQIYQLSSQLEEFELLPI